MDDTQLIEALRIDEGYRTIRWLAGSASPGQAPSTELVTNADGRTLVRKRIPAELANRQAWQELATVSYPLLPHVDAIYELPDQLVVVTDYVEGESLFDVVSRGGPGSGRVSSDVCRRIMLDLCAAASVLHAHGIVHRDIAPGNVIITPEGANLIDLGIARVYEEGVAHDTTTLGTWGFASPEQYGFAQTDARSDVFSLGRVLGYMLTGVLPQDPAYEPALLDPGVVSPQIRAVVDKACAFEPSARYQSADDLAVAIGEAMGRTTQGSVADGPEPPVPEPKAIDASGAPGSTKSVGKGGLRAALAGVAAVVSGAEGRGVLDVGYILSPGDFLELAKGLIASRNILRLLGSLMLLASALLWDLVAILSVVTDYDKIDLAILVANAIIFLTFSLFCVTLPARDASMALLRCGRYKDNPHPWRLVLARLIRGIIMFAIAIAVCIVIVGLWGPDLPAQG